ncbi:putative Radial spoke head protein 9 like protein [Blattamonas nauphoetae]|uniref:Radial spoke head protein 9 homolog n=1 Tax=Blattamonas nauphoetae TaxID=2049346 RepID=A0ABQ9YK37_9EUKA|nr:putative Radial spoke head protein 9 like protein [Blattamonas nauphoetae]
MGRSTLYNDAGVIFAQKEKSLLRTALTSLKTENKTKYIAYWGKIEGINADYFLIKAWDEYLGPAKYFYSNDMVDWAQVPEVDPHVEEMVKLDQSLYIGDPTIKTRFRDLTKLTKKDPTGEEEENAAPPEEEEEAEEAAPEEGAEEEEGAPKKPKKPSNFFTEDQRIAVFVRQIELNCQLVPRSFLYLNATHLVCENPSYKGLSQVESLKLTSYLHLRFPFDPIVRKNLEVKGVNKPFDFLDPADNDQPVGSWSLQYKSFVSLISIRSLLFPGYQVFLRPDTPEWGSVYVGNGLMNIDIPFTLPPISAADTHPHLLEKIMRENEEEERRRKEEEERLKREAEEQQEEEEQAEEQ